jgi:hypothetical protein
LGKSCEWNAETEDIQGDCRFQKVAFGFNFCLEICRGCLKVKNLQLRSDSNKWD